MATDLQRGKMGLCQRLRGCDGPFLLPCGLKSENKGYCEEWRKVPLKEEDITGTGDGIQIAPETFKRIKKEFGTPQ